MKDASGGPPDETGREAAREERIRRFEELELVRQQLERTISAFRRLGIEPTIGVINSSLVHLLKESCEHCLTVYFGE